MLSFTSPLQSAMPKKSRKSWATLAAAYATAGKTPSLILPRLYLSNYAVAADEEQLIALGITHVVSVLEIAPDYKSHSIKTLHVKLEDSCYSDILQHLDTTTKYIKTALEENETNKVLVSHHHPQMIGQNIH